MTNLTRMKRIELLLEEALVPRMAKVVRESGFSGHTVMPVLSGAGGRGAWQDERLTNSSRVMLLAIGPQEDADRLLAALRPLMDDYRLLLTIGDVEVLRQDHF